MPILAGTDAPNPGTAHGASIHRELELLVQAGLSPAEALAAATSTPARIFGLKDRGRIAPGLRADLVLVKGDPTADITASRDILRVWKIGQEVPRPKAAATAAAAKAPAAAVPASGEISDFEDGTLKATLRLRLAGLHRQAGRRRLRVVQKEVVEGGASGTAKSLAISGEVKAGFAFPWAGDDVPPRRAAHGTGGPLQVLRRLLLDQGGRPRLPAHALRHPPRAACRPMKSFTAGPDWQQVTVPFAELGPRRQRHPGHLPGRRPGAGDIPLPGGRRAAGAEGG